MRNFHKTIVPALLAVLIAADNGQAQSLYWSSNGLPVCTAENWQRKPMLVPDGASGAVAVWENLRSGSKPAIFAARITVQGTLPWAANGVEVSPAESGQLLGSVISDGAGGAIVVYVNRKGGTSDIFAQRIDGNGAVRWQTGGVPVCTADGAQEYPIAAPDGEGGAYIAWQDKRGADRDIYAQRIDHAGTLLWQENGFAVCTAPNDQTYPTAAANQRGVFIAWMDKRTEDDIYAQFLAPGGEPVWAVDFPVANEPNRQLAPKAQAFGDSSAAIIWQDFRGFDNSSAVYLQILTPSGVPEYPNGFPLSQSPAPQNGLYLTDDGLKGIVAVWTDYRKGTGEGDIFYRRVKADKTIIGSDFGDPLCDYSGSQELPAIVADPAGGTFAVWQDKRNTFDYDLYMNRLTATGLSTYKQWNQKAGLTLMKADLNQLGPQIVPSGLGAAIVVWYDGRVQDGEADIYAQRIAYAPWIDSDTLRHFGVLNPGATEFDTVRIFNNGTVPLNVSKNIRRVRAASFPVSDLTFLDFAVASVPDSDFVVQPGGWFDVAVQFSPTQGGVFGADVQIRSDASADPYSIRFLGTGYAPAIAVPNTLSLGTVKTNKHLDTLVTGFIRNTGYGDLIVNDIQILGPFAPEFEFTAIPDFPLTVPTGGEYHLHLTYHPIFDGMKELQLRVLSNTPTPQIDVRVYANSEYPKLRANPFQLNFGVVKEMTTATKSMTISNTSQVLLEVGMISIQSADSSRFVPASTGGFTLAPSEFRTVEIAFTPDTERVYTATLIVYSDDRESPRKVTILGEGGTPSSTGNLPVALVPSLEPPYPNPVSLSRHTSAAFALACGSASGTATFTVTDALGRTVYAAPVQLISGTALTFAVPLGSAAFNEGVYVYTLRYRNGNVSGKMAVVR